MHVILGVAMMFSAFGLALLAHRQMEFGGLFNPAALVLLVLGPLAATMIAQPFAEWLNAFRVLFRAFRHDKKTSIAISADEMTRIARAIRESRLDEADQLISGARSEHVRDLCPHILARMELEALRDAIAASAYRWMAEVRSADEFFQGLARLSPALGMIGTIMGLVDLFANMRDSASLGPGMAMALLATLYGLFLCYCVYMPLALRIRTYLAAGIGEQRVIEHSLGLIAEGRPIQEVRNAFSGAAARGADLRSSLPTASADLGHRP